MIALKLPLLWMTMMFWLSILAMYYCHMTSHLMQLHPLHLVSCRCRNSTISWMIHHVQYGPMTISLCRPIRLVFSFVVRSFALGTIHFHSISSRSIVIVLGCLTDSSLKCTGVRAHLLRWCHMIVYRNRRSIHTYSYASIVVSTVINHWWCSQNLFEHFSLIGLLSNTQ